MDQVAFFYLFSPCWSGWSWTPNLRWSVLLGLQSAWIRGVSHHCSWPIFHNYPETWIFSKTLFQLPQNCQCQAPRHLYPRSWGHWQDEMCLFFQGSTSFSSVTVAFAQEGWRYLVSTSRDRFKDRIPEKSRNLVLLGKETVLFFFKI